MRLRTSKSKIRSLLASTCILIAGAQASHADIGSDLAGFWERAGGGVNVTRPQTYDGQRAGYATLGSLYVRTAQRNAQLINIQLPSIRAGCGGIDIFGGAFSFISKEELVQLMRGIMQNAAGFAFELALKSMSPAVQDIVADLRALIERVNNMNINSCEAGQLLAGSLWPAIDNASQHICKTIGNRRGYFADFVAGRHDCGQGGRTTDTLQNAGDELADQVPVDVNYAWKATRRHALLANDRRLAEFFMTLTGTIITTAPANDDEGPGHRVIPPQVASPSMLRILIEGGQATRLVCNDTELCLNPVSQNVSFPASSSLYTRVEALIKELAEAIDLDQEPSAEAIALLDMSPHPILKTLVTAKAYKYQFVDDDIALMAQYVAIEVAMQYLSEALEEMSAAAGNSETFGDIGREFQQNIRQTQNNFNQLRSIAFERYSQAVEQLNKLRIAEEELAAMGAQRFSGALTSGGN